MIALGECITVSKTIDSEHFHNVELYIELLYSTTANGTNFRVDNTLHAWEFSSDLAWRVNNVFLPLFSTGIS